MTAAAHDQTLLALIKTQLGSRVPTALTNIAAGGGPTLTAPLLYEILDDLNRVQRVPHCGITVERSPQETWQTHQRDSNPSLFIAITHAPNHDDPATADSDARYYARALDIALTRAWMAGSLTGCWKIEIDEIDQEQVGADRNRRRGYIRARAWYRTSQET